MNPTRVYPGIPGSNRVYPGTSGRTRVYVGLPVPRETGVVSGICQSARGYVLGNKRSQMGDGVCEPCANRNKSRVGRESATNSPYNPLPNDGRTPHPETIELACFCRESPQSCERIADHEQCGSNDGRGRGSAVLHPRNDLSSGAPNRVLKIYY